MSVITKEVIDHLEKLLTSTTDVNTINKQLQSLEPELVKWCQTKARDDIDKFLRGGIFINPELLNDLGNRLVAARLSGYLLAQIGQTHQFYGEIALHLGEDGKIDEDIEKDYERWINGELPKKYYNYDVTSAMRRSKDEAKKAMVKAYDNFIAKQKEREEEDRKNREYETKKDTLSEAKKAAGIKTEKVNVDNVVSRSRRPKGKRGNDLDFDDPGKK